MLNQSCNTLDGSVAQTVPPDDRLLDVSAASWWTGPGNAFFRFSLLWLIFLAGVSSSKSWGQPYDSGSSGRSSREQATKLIPYAQLNQTTREKITDVMDSASLYRRLPVNSIAADPDYFRFLVRYPEVIVNIWQIMGVTQMSTTRTGAFTIDTDDGGGTTSTLDLIFGNENLNIFYGEGVYEGPVFRRKINGRCVLILRTDYRQDPQGQSHVINQMDVFLKLDNVGANLMAKTIQPIVGSTADQNFSDSLKFIQRLHETTVENGPGVQHMAYRLNIDDEVRQKFIEAAGLVYERAGEVRINSEQQRMTVPSMVGHSSYNSDSKMDSNSVGTSPTRQPASNHYNQPPATIQPVNGTSTYSVDQQIPVYRPSPSYSAPAYGTIR